MRSGPFLLVIAPLLHSCWFLHCTHNIRDSAVNRTSIAGTKFSNTAFRLVNLNRVFLNGFIRQKSATIR